MPSAARPFPAPLRRRLMVDNFVETVGITLHAPFQPLETPCLFYPPAVERAFVDDVDNPFFPTLLAVLCPCGRQNPCIFQPNMRQWDTGQKAPSFSVPAGKARFRPEKGTKRGFPPFIHPLFHRFSTTATPLKCRRRKGFGHLSTYPHRLLLRRSLYYITTTPLPGAPPGER